MKANLLFNHVEVKAMPLITRKLDKDLRANEFSREFSGRCENPRGKVCAYCLEYAKGTERVIMYIHEPITEAAQ